MTDAAADAAINRPGGTQPIVIDVIVFDTQATNPVPTLRLLFPPPSQPPPCTRDYIPLCSCGSRVQSPETRRPSHTISLYFPNDLITDFVGSDYFVFPVPVGSTSLYPAQLPDPAFWLCDKMRATTFTGVSQCGDNSDVDVPCGPREMSNAPNPDIMLNEHLNSPLLV